jgi:hypothetical protein
MGKIILDKEFPLLFGVQSLDCVFASAAKRKSSACLKILIQIRHCATLRGHWQAKA